MTESDRVVEVVGEQTGDHPYDTLDCSQGSTAESTESRGTFLWRAWELIYTLTMYGWWMRRTERYMDGQSTRS